MRSATFEPKLLALRHLAPLGWDYLASGHAPAAALVTAALAWRRERPADDEAAELLSRELTPLYVQYLDDHIARLQALDSYLLADGFRRWRARLLA